MPWQPQRKDRGKALVLVTGLHLLLGAGLVIGLAGEPIRKAAERLTAVDILLPPPEPEPEPEPPRDDSAPAAREEAGEPDLKARPAPVVLPPPPRPLPSRNPLATADDSAPDTGAAASAGAGAETGPGRGAGGDGTGTGGGGSGGEGAGDGGGLGTEARLLSGNLTRRDYRRIRSFGSPSGFAVLELTIAPDGAVARCQPATSSGDPALDSSLCGLLSRTRWSPARDRQGRPVTVSLRYVATWDRD